MTATNVDPRQQEQLNHALAHAAKLICSARYVSERDLENIVQDDIVPHLGAYEAPIDWDEFEFEVDEQSQTVTTRFGGVSRRARCHASQGCLILPEQGNEIYFTPTTITPQVPDPTTTDWPMGDRLPEGTLPSNVDKASLDATLDWAFDDSQRSVPARTRAVLVVHQDQIIAERYAPGFGPDTQQVSWSMGKSITAALIGLLVGDGELELDQPVPVPEWSGAEDPRREITLRNLLNMSSGLDFIRATDDERLDLRWTSDDHHMAIYTSPINVFEHAVSRPLGYPPNTRWAYRNGDPLTLGKIIREKVEARGEDYLSYPQRALFDRIGMGSMTLETDRWGNFILTGFDYGTPRNWARFAMLHKHDGIWPATGERILPEGWVDFISTPAPAAEEQQYGGQFWLNLGGSLPDVPRDAYTPRGARGQVAMVIPSRDTIVVRMGHHTDDGFDDYLNELVRRILESIDS